MQEKYWNEIYWKKHLDNFNDRKLDFTQNLWLEKYRKVLEKIPKNNALDLGCGLGQYSMYLMNNGFKVTSTDISGSILQKVKQNIKGVNCVKLDMVDNFPFEDNSFDLVFANLSIHYFNDIKTKHILKEVKRVLNKGGYFIGTVNSTELLKIFGQRLTKIDKNFYRDTDRNIRLWDRQQFDLYFKDFNIEVLEEVIEERWKKKKIIWEFIAKVRK